MTRAFASEAQRKSTKNRTFPTDSRVAFSFYKRTAKKGHGARDSHSRFRRERSVPSGRDGCNRNKRNGFAPVCQSLKWSSFRESCPAVRAGTKTPLPPPPAQTILSSCAEYLTVCGRKMRTVVFAVLVLLVSVANGQIIRPTHGTGRHDIPNQPLRAPLPRKSSNVISKKRRGRKKTRNLRIERRDHFTSTTVRGAKGT